MTNYGQDIDVIPVRESNFAPGRKNMANEKDNFAQRAAQQRRTIAQWTRDDLEDKYLRIYEENLLLKKHARKQEDKIKRMATKLLRLVSDKKKAEQGTVKKVRDIETEEMLEELHGKIREVEKQNHALREKLLVSKQQAAAVAKRSTVYGHVQSRIDTGIQKPPPDPRVTKNLRVSGPASTRPAPHSPVQQPRYGHSVLEETRAENRHLESVVEQLNEQGFIYEQDIELLKEQMRVREAEYEEDLLKLKQQMSHGQRTAIQENIDIIKLQREVKEKSTKLTAMQGQYSQLEDKLQTVRVSHDQVLTEMERLNHQLKEAQNRNLRLDNELKNGSANQRRIVELEERVTDFERECDILKEANEKLVSSAFDMEREREWRKKEAALKVQIAQLEATLKADVGEKGSILDKMTEERDDHDKLQDEHKQLRIDFFQLKQEADDLRDKMKFFTKESAVDFQEIEEALMIVKQRKAKDDQELDFLIKVDTEKVRDYEKLVAELQAEHADTINELEKTRNMLIVQHKINKDYQMEVEAVTKKMDENTTEYETKLQEYAQLLDIRAGRIRKLETQLRDVAYGTRQYRTRAEDQMEEEEDSDVEELDETLHLERGQNLVEIHVKRFVLSEEGRRALNDDEPSLFCTWEFYEFEIQSTPVMRNAKPEFQFTSQYLVTVDDFFLHYLQRDSATLELHQSMGTDFRTLGACQLKMKEVLEKTGGRLHATAQIFGVDDSGVNICYGTIEYWVRMRVPMAQALRLYKERCKALGYIDSNQRATEEALHAMDETAARRPPDNINELTIKIVRCQNVLGRREGIQPSPFVVYKFFDYEDHDTAIVTGSNTPQYNDRKVFPTPMTAELDKYLKSKCLLCYVFDDTDPEEAEYLGVAKVPMLPLAHDKAIHGIFELHRRDGNLNGTMEVNLKWSHTYLPPKTSTRTPAQEQLLSSVSQDVPERLPMLPGEEEQLRGQSSTMIAGSPGVMPTTPVAPRPPSHPQGPSAVSTPMPKSRVKRGGLAESPLSRVQEPPMSSGEPSVAVSVTLTPPTARDEVDQEDSVMSEGTHVTGESEPLSEASTPRESGPEPISAISGPIMSPMDRQMEDILEATEPEDDTSVFETEEMDTGVSYDLRSSADVQGHQFDLEHSRDSFEASRRKLLASSQLTSDLSTTMDADVSEAADASATDGEQGAGTLTMSEDAGTGQLDETGDQVGTDGSMLETGTQEQPVDDEEPWRRPVPTPRRTLSREFSVHDFGSFSSINSSYISTQSFRGTKGFLRKLSDPDSDFETTPSLMSSLDAPARRSRRNKLGGTLLPPVIGLETLNPDKRESKMKHKKKSTSNKKNKSKARDSQSSLDDSGKREEKEGRREKGRNGADREESVDDMIAEELGERTKSDDARESADTMFGDEASGEQEHTDEVEEDIEEDVESEDSEGVVVRSSLSRAPSTTALGNPDAVAITISHLALDEQTTVMDNTSVKMLFVEYRFCGIDLQETETPFSLPKPLPNKEIAFNFRKVFWVDHKNNYERRQFLASMLLPDDPEQGRIRFTVVSEPPEDEDDAECEDVGVAFVSLQDILSEGKDVIDQDLPIYDIKDESTEIGSIRLSVECLAALHAVEQEITMGAQTQPEEDY